MIGISRNVHRCHDNPFAECDKIVFIFDMKRWPSPSVYSQQVSSYQYSIHQCWFLLNSLFKHMEDLKKLGYACQFIKTNDLKKTIRTLSHEHSNVLTDRMEDPAYSEFDQNLVSEFQRVKFCSPSTLVDWNSPLNFEKANSYFDTAYKKTAKLKKYILKHRRKPYPTLQKKEQKGTAQGINTLSKMINELKKIGENVDLYPFSDLFQKKNFDRDVLRVAKMMATRINHKKWYKPKTARNLSLLEHPQNPIYDSSKMSPFFATGVLSVAVFFSFLERDGEIDDTCGKAADQLLFRECWYVAAIADRQTKNKFWSSRSGWWDPKRKYTPVFALSHQSWLKQNKKVLSWIYGTMDGEWKDANHAMKTLFRTGWLHHLQRHLVADVLCRGKLKKHFMYGEQWFRQTLVDADAVVNRANWLWLSANAFSTKQYFLHYNPVDYILRGSKAVFKTSRELFRA